MKNKQIIDSWNKIEPDSAADARMLEAILARNQPGKTKQKEAYSMKKTYNWKRLAPIAACLALAVAGAVIIPQLRTPVPDVTTSPPSATAKTPDGVQEMRCELPVMLAGQKVAWENAEQQAQDGFAESVYVYLDLSRDTPNASATGKLEDGRTITLGTEELWSGPQAEYEDVMLGLRTGGSLSYAWSGSLDDPKNLKLEVGATIFVNAVHNPETNTSAIYCGYIQAIG